MGDTINNILASINGPLWTYGIALLLIGAGIYFTLGTGFVQFRHMWVGVKSLAEDSLSFEDAEGLTDYQGFSVSVASRVGIGTITGVASAITIGGPGSIFWMWALSLLGMASAFVEGILAQVYKEELGHGFVGGPAYYLKKALNHKFLAIIFAVLMIIVYGLIFNLVQANEIEESLRIYEIPSIWSGIFLGIVMFLVIKGGNSRVAAFCTIAVPLMLVIYLCIVLLVVILHLSEIPHFFSLIFSNAFSADSIAGGTLGTVIMQGVQRGFYTSEAGMGSGPHAAAMAHTSHPVKQGAVQSFSVFFEMFLICGGTAFIILTSEFYMGGGADSSVRSFSLVRESLSTQLFVLGDFFLVLTMLLFGFTTIIGNFFYAEANLRFLTSNQKVRRGMRIIFSLAVISAGILKFSILMSFADFLMAFIAILNIYAIVRLFPIARAAIRNFDEQRKQGVNPVFSRDIVKTREKKYETLVWPENKEDAEKLYNHESDY